MIIHHASLQIDSQYIDCFETSENDGVGLYTGDNVE